MQDDKKRLKIAEQPMTPDEEHRIEVRVDKMLSVEPLSQSDKKTKRPRRKVAAKPPAEKVITEATPKPEATTPMDGEPSGPPPLLITGDYNNPEDTQEEEILPETEPVVEQPPIDLATVDAQAVAEPQVDSTDASTAPELPEQSDADTFQPIEENSEQTPESAQQASQDTGPQPDDTNQTADKSEAQKQDVQEDTNDLAEADIEAAFVPPQQAGSSRLKRLIRYLWQNPKTRWLFWAVPIVLIIACSAWPISRAVALNIVGVRASATLTVLDATTNLPLKDVTVSIGGAAGLTDHTGTITLKHVKLGEQTLTVVKSAFATSTKKSSIGLGNNSLGNVMLQAAGNQYRVKVIDYVTGKPVGGASATSGEATAVADSKGIITLTLPEHVTGKQKVTIRANNYRSEPAELTGGGNLGTVQLVISRPEVYFSNQSGKYDLYRSDIDGKNAKVILAASGLESNNLQLQVHAKADEAAIVGTRDDFHDSGGYLLQTLTLINTKSGSTITVDHSQRIELIDWAGDRIVYVMARAGASAANASRYQLMSYDYRTNQRLELDHANAFNDVVSAGGYIYYATSNQYNGSSSQFVRQLADGTKRQVLLNAEVWNILRKDYKTFYLSTGGDNYTYNVGNVGGVDPTKTSDKYVQASKLYIDSPDGRYSIWMEIRDGKNTLLLHDNNKNSDRVLVQQSGANYPVRWLNNEIIVYRVSEGSGSADFATAVGTNTAKKITDLTNARGKSLWYFY